MIKTGMILCWRSNGCMRLFPCSNSQGDGSVFDDALTGGADGVAHSHTAFLGIWGKPLRGVSYPFVYELLALREGVTLSQLRGYSHVIMEVN